MAKLTIRDAEAIYKNLKGETPERIAEAVEIFSQFQDKFHDKIKACKERLFEISFVQLDLFDTTGGKVVYRDASTGATVEMSDAICDINYKKAASLAKRNLNYNWIDASLSKYFKISVSINKEVIAADLAAGTLHSDISRCVSTKAQPSLFVLKEELKKKTDEEDNSLPF